MQAPQIDYCEPGVQEKDPEPVDRYPDLYPYPEARVAKAKVAYPVGYAVDLATSLPYCPRTATTFSARYLFLSHHRVKIHSHVEIHIRYDSEMRTFVIQVKIQSQS